MSTGKKNPNPFINMANEAKKNKALFATGKNTKQGAPKPSKGFSGPTVVRRSGRGG